MKRIYFFLALALSGLLLAACQVPSLQTTVQGSGRVVREEREVSAIRRIEMSGFGRLIVTQGEREALSIEAEDNFLPYLLTEMKGDTLVVREKPLFSFKTSQPILFHLTVRSLEELRLLGFAQAEINSLQADELSVRMGDFTQLALNSLQARNLAAQMNGFSQLSVSGAVSQAHFDRQENARIDDQFLAQR